MSLWVNALATRSGGGLTVLEGLGRALVEQSDAAVRFLVRADVRPLLPEPVRSSAVVGPAATGLVGRLWWEQARLTRDVAKQGDVVLGLSNLTSVVGARGVRQAVLVQNVAPLSREIRGMYGGGDRLRLELLRGLTLRSVRTARVTFVFTDYLERLVRSLVPTAKIVRIPPGGALDTPPMPVHGSGEAPYVVVLSDLRRYKGIEDAIRAIARPALDGLRVLVCGDTAEPDYRNHLQRVASELGVGRRIEFRAPAKRQEVGGLIDEAVCLLQTSRIESLGLPLIEGLSRGAPVVSTDIPSAREVGGNDIALYRPGDIDALASAIATARDEERSTRAAVPERDARFEWRESALAVLEELRA